MHLAPVCPGGGCGPASARSCSRARLPGVTVSGKVRLSAMDQGTPSSLFCCVWWGCCVVLVWRVCVFFEQTREATEPKTTTANTTTTGKTRPTTNDPLTVDADVGVPRDDRARRKVHPLAHQVAPHPPPFSLEARGNGLDGPAAALQRGRLARDAVVEVGGDMELQEGGELADDVPVCRAGGGGGGCSCLCCEGVWAVGVGLFFWFVVRQAAAARALLGPSSRSQLVKARHPGEDNESRHATINDTPHTRKKKRKKKKKLTAARRSASAS